MNAVLVLVLAVIAAVAGVALIALGVVALILAGERVSFVAWVAVIAGVWCWLVAIAAAERRYHPNGAA